MPPFTDFLPHRWLRRRPERAGVYAMRYGLRDSLVSYFEPSHQREPLAVTPGHVVADVEFLYLLDDVPGFPTRADDRRLIDRAIAHGWRPHRES